MNFWKWLLGWRKKIDREKTTEEFRAFEDEENKILAENIKNGAPYYKKSRQYFLIEYFLKEGKSPFEGDSCLREARKFMKEYFFVHPK